MIFNDEKHRGELDGYKLGISASFPLKKTEHRNVKFYISYDALNKFSSQYVNDRKGKTVSSLPFFPAISKEVFQSLNGVLLLDKIETVINSFYIGLKDYLSSYTRNSQYSLTSVQIAEFNKIITTISTIAERIEIVSCITDNNLKTQKGAQNAIEELLLMVNRITNHNRYENLSLSPHQIRFDFQYKHPYFDGKRMLIDAESYFNRTLQDSLNELETHIEKKVSDAKQKGSNLLLSLANGDIGVNEFDKKIGDK